MTNYTDFCSSNHRNLFLLVLEAGRPGPRFLQGYCLPKPRPLVADGPLLAVPSCGLPSMCVYLLTSSSYEDTSQIGLWTPLRTSFKVT